MTRFGYALDRPGNDSCSYQNVKLNSVPENQFGLGLRMLYLPTCDNSAKERGSS